jgi:hypothetical protein
MLLRPTTFGVILSLSIASCGTRESNRPVDDAPAPLTLTPPVELNDSAMQLIGYVGFERFLRDRIAAEPDNFFLNYYLLGYGFSYLDDLSALMGVHEGRGQTSDFRNAAPSSVNALLYDLVIAGVAGGLVAHCQEPVPALPAAPKYRADVLEMVNAVCRATDEEFPDAAAKLYMALIGYSLPEHEFDEWQRFFAEEYQTNDPHLRARDAVYTALFNPYLLLTN